MTVDTTSARPSEPTAPVPDPEAVGAFAQRLFEFYTGGMLTYLIDIGARTGLFAAATAGPATSGRLAERAGLQERYVREWLGAMVTAGILELDPVTSTYTLPEAHAACLTGGGVDDLAPFARLNTHLARHVGRIAEVFRTGGGVPYAEYRPEFTDVMDGLGRPGFAGALVDTWLGLVPDVRDRLANGAHVVDVGCGTGYALNLLATTFPASRFVGYDLADDAIARARDEAATLGLTNVRFEVRDAAVPFDDDPFDVALVFDAIHDQAAPATVLRNIHGALAPGGVFLMFEPAVSSDVSDNIAHPMAPFIYAISTLHCLTISLAEGGAGLGAAWGRQVACEMLGAAGFGGIEVLDLPDEPINALFVARR